MGGAAVPGAQYRQRPVAGGTVKAAGSSGPCLATGRMNQIVSTWDGREATGWGQTRWGGRLPELWTINPHGPQLVPFSLDARITGEIKSAFVSCLGPLWDSKPQEGPI